MTLNEVMKETADAIREKKGTSELIAPVNFAEEIKGISAGGGASEDEWKYFDVSALGIEAGAVVGAVTHLVKVDGGIVGGGELGMLGDKGAKAIATNLDMPFVDGEFKITRDYLNFRSNDTGGLSMLDIILMSGCTEITKEQFYDLNA